MNPLDSLPWLRNRQFLMVLLGWLALFVPVYLWAFNTLWQSEDQSHGPLIVAVCLWLFWQQKERLWALPARS